MSEPDNYEKGLMLGAMIACVVAVGAAVGLGLALLKRLAEAGAV